MDGNVSTSGKEIEEVINKVLQRIPKEKYSYALKHLGTKSPTFEYAAEIKPTNEKAAKLEILFDSKVREVSFAAGNAFFMEWYWHHPKTKNQHLDRLYNAWVAIVSGNYREQHWGKNRAGKWKWLVGVYKTPDGKQHNDGCVNNLLPGWIKSKFFIKRLKSSNTNHTKLALFWAGIVMKRTVRKSYGSGRSCCYRALGGYQ